MGIKYNEYEVDMLFGNYGNGNLAIIFVGSKGSQYEGEDIVDATVNGNIQLKTEDICGFKAWNEGPGIVECLVQEGIIHPDVNGIEPAGFSQIHYHRLTEKGKQIRDANRME